MLNKHQLKTAATKRKLLASAQRVFTRDGFEAARIDDIAQEAGFTRGAFYAHFKTKEELFLALLEDQAGRRINQLRTVLSEQPDEPARLEALREYYANQLSDKVWSILLLEFKLYAVRHTKDRKRLAAAHRRIRSGVKFEPLKGLIPSSIRPDSRQKEQTRFALEALLSGLVLQRVYDPESLDVAQAKKLLRACFDALLPANSETNRS